MERKIKDIFPAPSFQYKITPNEVTIPKFSRMTHEFTAAEWSLLQNVGKKIGVSPVAMICEIYAEVLAYWSNQPCFTINFTAFNRYPCHPDVDLMIGDFTSVLLIKLDMRENDAYEERVKSCKMKLIMHWNIDYMMVLKLLENYLKIIHRKQSRLCRLFLRVCYMEDDFRGMILER